MSEGAFTWTNLQTGEKWTFPDMESLQAFLSRKGADRTTLAGSAVPEEKVEAEEGWPQPAPLPEDYWESAQ